MNSFENFALALKDVILSAMIERLGQNEFIVRKYMEEPEFQTTTNVEMAKRIWDEVRSGEAPAWPQMPIAQPPDRG